MQILDKSPSSDHLPVRAKFKLDCTMIDSDGTKNSSNVAMSVTNFQWAKATDVHIGEYKSNTHMILKTFGVPGAIFCKDANCKDDHHNSDIDAYYTTICEVLLVASRKHIPSFNFRCSQNYVVPGFNKHLKDLHDKPSKHFSKTCKQLFYILS